MKKSRPLMIIPIGLAALYNAQAAQGSTRVSARADNVVSFAEIRTVDPTHPGHDFVDELRGDYPEDAPNDISDNSSGAGKVAASPYLYIVKP